MTYSPIVLCLLFVFFYCTLFKHVVVSSRGQCLSDQQSLLLQFKNNLIFEPTESKSLVTWNQSSDCCTWEGISCEQGRVTGLKLSNESISGGINNNSTLFNLQYLQSLDLSYNLINSTIPSRIGNLKNLRYLNFSFVFWGQIPQEISHLKKLLILDLSHYDSSDLYFYDYVLEIPNLRFVVQNLTKLEELYLDSVHISTPGNEWGQAISSSLPNLRVLSLSECLLSGSIHQSLAKLQHLSVIELSHNNLSSPVPRSFGNFSNLTSLQLNGCNLHGTFPKEIFQVPTLRILSMSDNGLLDGSLPEFPPSSDLQFLDISFTNFKGRLPSSIGNLRQLTDLDLSNCLFSGPLPKSISKLTQLVYLGLSNNQFVGPISSFDMTKNLEQIDLSSNNLSGPISSAHLKGLLNLVSIDLRSNSFNGNIPSSLFTLPLLEEIDLSYNQFSGEVLEFPNPSSSMLDSIDLSSNKLQGTIPMSIFKLTELHSLSLSFNMFNGTIHLDTSLGFLQNLNLSHNQLVSIQEPSLYNIYNLRTLDLGFNQLDRKIPILPPNIYYVDLSSNSFTSSIPSESICNARNLQYLDLSNNSLTGIIPACMHATGTTFEVKLHNNNLSGPIPDLFPLSCRLRTLDLSGNLLTKSIPKSLANCPALEYLNLGNNQMLDTFPMLLKSISGLQVLVLRSNKFYGQITCTESIDHWPMIQIVDIASNNFSGELPGKCLTTWLTKMTDDSQPQLSHLFPISATSNPHFTFSQPEYSDNVYNRSTHQVHDNYDYAVSIINKGLKMQMLKILFTGFTYIDFSSNKFHGEIPKEFGQLISLYGLNLSNNLLSGQIPSSFGNMRQLESLDLSRNHLSGKIPESLSNLSFLGFLNLSYNQLHGRIPGGHTQAFLEDSFQGNQGLCGLPVTSNCPGDAAAPDTSPKTPKANHSTSANNEIEWNLISAEIGFLVGFGTVLGPLVFWKRWRKWYFDRVEDIAFSILPQILLRKWLSWKMGTRKGVRVGGRRAS
ncbi:hypothetical protein FNV43_RR08811 [Rhamnella rubrinervis]|uniref:Leucine-rich repeat-containing N-terminal plant-type domain-containing protein n=1 Tax=Rhamnella rubrinervis TaxID=2594499 RepID=A0A8K0MJ99_9ROSA|nr:hypothetical protein FNV43_RR08811 [Rhamnella rubrinervis]